MSKQGKVDYSIFKRLLKYVKPYRKMLVIAFLCTLVLAVLSPARPFLIGKMVDSFIIKNQDANALLNWSLIFIGTFIFRRSVSIFR
jgi:ATP-binding cassette, subfamily B, multidrug efflux pump